MPGKAHIRVALCLAALAGLFLPAVASWAQAPAQPMVDPQALVRRSVEKELNVAGKGQYMYHLRRETPNGAQTRQIIETRDGLVARTIAINDKPLTAEERRLDDLRLQKLLADPQEQLRRKQEQQSHEERVRKLVSALPDAFLYTLEAVEEGPYGKMYRLRFVPNPKFEPPSREAHVLRGMEGQAWIHAREERLVRINARLVEDVNFGWGILGKLHRGGSFSIQQQRLPEGRWETTRMQLDFTGRVLLFKKLTVQQLQTASEFRPVPPNLSLAQGIEMLRAADGVVAGKTTAMLPSD